MIQKLIPKPLSRRLRNMVYSNGPVLWANWGILSKCLAQIIKPKQPPVLILSMPRSGSSWVGEILGLAQNSIFLFEPFSKSLLKHYGIKNVCFEVEPENLPETYETTRNRVVNAMPLFPKEIIRCPNQWLLSKRKSKRLIIKEVNPYMLSWLTQTCHFRVIYLVRHPASVASSFERLGWHKSKFELSVSEKTLRRELPDYKRYCNSYLSEQGAIQAFSLIKTLAVLKEYKDFMLIKYEDLCGNPLKLYKELYDFAGLTWSNTTEELILKRTEPDEINAFEYSTARNSQYEMTKWKQELSEDKIQQIKDAWLSLNPPVYTESDW